MKKSGGFWILSLSTVMIFTLILAIPQRAAKAACGIAVPCPPAPGGSGGDTGEKEKHRKPTATDVPPTDTPTATPTDTPTATPTETATPTATATTLACVIPPVAAANLPDPNPQPGAGDSPVLPWVLGGGGLIIGLGVGFFAGGVKPFNRGGAGVNGDGIVGPDKAWNGDGIVGPDKAWDGNGLSSAALKLQKADPAWNGDGIVGPDRAWDGNGIAGPDKAWNGDGLSSSAVKLQKADPALKFVRDAGELQDGGEFHKDQDGGGAATPSAPTHIDWGDGHTGDQAHMGDASVRPTE